MKKRKKNYIDPEKLASMADKEEDITEFLPEKLGRKPIDVYKEKKAAFQLNNEIVRRSIDFNRRMYAALDEISKSLNISTSAVIKMALQEYLMRYSIYLKETETGKSHNDKQQHKATSGK